MWQALANAALPVKAGGKLFIAIYNDQGTASRRWKKVKQLYNGLPRPLRFLVVWPSFWILNWRSMVKDLLRGRPFQSLRDQGLERGMSFWRDLIDWVGGYPFEVATPEQIFDCRPQPGFLTLRNCALAAAVWAATNSCFRRPQRRSYRRGACNSACRVHNRVNALRSLREIET